MSKRTFGIRQRVLIITLLPLSMITLLLGSYFITTRLDDAQTSLVEKGQIMAQMMASSAEFGLLVGNTEILQGLIRSSTKAPEVSDVVFLNPAFEILARGQTNSQPLDKDAGYPLYQNNQVHFLHPVIATGVDVIDNPDFVTEEPEPEFIGWVVIILSEEPTKERQFEILTKGIILALIGLLGTLFIASRFGQRITNPILGLTHVIEMLQHGHLETRASLSSTGELRSLAQGINRLAQRVQESNQNLESRVDKATKRLRSTLVHLEKQNQALDKARKRADNANTAKDEFLARMSHEIRTPLTSVSGFARLLDQTDLQVEQKEYTRIINLTSGLLLSIIDDILDYSKLESNAIELEEIPFEFENCVLDVLEMQTATAYEKGIELIPAIDPETPRFLIGDPVRLRQILTNIVSNAIKFTSDGEVSIVVTAHNQSSVESELQIVIKDTGAGIPAERIQHLFKAFSQADTSITRRYGGSGLGLVIAKRLTELMSGHITLQSEEGAGTEVTLSIPFTASPRQRITAKLKVGQVLVYDENPLVRQGICQQLMGSDAHVVELTTVQELLKQAENAQDSAIIWGLNSSVTTQHTVDSITGLLHLFDGQLILLSGQPLPIYLPKRVVQLRKPPRTQLLLNALSPESYRLPEEQSSLDISGAPTVLVAEDNDFNRLLIHRILEQAGTEVVLATTGEEAVQQALTAQPDVIVMDVHMPVMDGIEATRQIRLTQPEVPILALTANVVASEHQKLIRAGVNHVLLKPINDHELCHTINAYLSEDNAFTLPSSPQEDTTQLEQYDISLEQLSDELKNQLEGLLEGFHQGDIKLMRHHSHQLMGIAGLYQIPELEVAGNNLHDALIDEDFKTIWKELWQTKRIIENEQFEPSEPL